MPFLYFKILDIVKRKEAHRLYEIYGFEKSCYGFELILQNKKKSQKRRIYVISETLRAGDERIELPPKVLETPIIPLDQSPVFACRTRYL